MTRLIYPHLLCFAYQSQAPEPHETWVQWQQTSAAVPSPGTPDAAIYKGDHLDWEARYEHKNLGDTDGLFLITAAKEKTTPQPIEFLARLKQNCATLTGDVGQTWLVLAQQAADTSVNEIVKAIRALWPTQPLEQPHEGFFLGLDLFTFRLPHNQQLVILLASDADKMAQVADFYYELQRLFYYRHKVVWSYQQNEIIKQELVREKFFPLPEETILGAPGLSESEALRADLGELRMILYRHRVKFDRHTRGIAGLTLQLETLKTNLNAYQTRLERIDGKAQNREKYATPLDLTPWSDFIDDTTATYQEQIRQNIASLKPGLTVREQHINTLKAIIETAQAERDRAFQLFVESAGVGLGTAGFTGTVLNTTLETYIEEHPRTTTFVTVGAIQIGSSVLVGLLCCLLTLWFRRRTFRSR